MQQNLIKRELTWLDVEVADQDAYFASVADELVRRGYVKSTFLAALKEREGKFPTALPTQPEAIAIPHVDPEHVIEPFIAPARLKQPIGWQEMGKSDVTDQVRIVFMLGFTRSEGHVEVLQMLLKSCQDPNFMKALADATSADQYYDAVHDMRGLTN